MTKASLKTPAPVPQEPAVNAALGAKFGLKGDEYDRVLKILGRTPTFTELGIFSVMWSEHCSYKSSRIHLKKLPTTAPWVIQGPGENAGVIDIGDNQAAVFTMESHNHPSYIEPYQGAATGVGGIMRDVFTMGARPIANMNALRFGDPSHPKTKHLVAGVVAGIAGYGNCMGVPTVGGETNFHAAYNGNILVNAMTVGLADQDKIYYARGASVGQPVVYVGSKTGKDGIHGATMASTEFEDDKEAERPTVQVGDPFVEKLLLEACLELMQQDAIISIQDMGAAGLTSSSVEIADKGGIGVELDLDRVPQREPNMTAYELMLSESQERMLMILKPGREDDARAIFEKWDLDFAVIGKTTNDQRLRLNMYGKVWCDIPVPPLVNEAPLYDRPQGPYPAPSPLPELKAKGTVLENLKTLLACPDLSSKRWIWEQYDSLVMGQTRFSPGTHDTQSGFAGDAALVLIPSPHRGEGQGEGATFPDSGAKGPLTPTLSPQGRGNEWRKALAITCDVTPRYCQANPFEGGKQAVAESYRNLSAVGALPLAVTNNLNFGNPEKPEIMTQFVKCLDGMGEACRALDYPIISGNVSLYNETSGRAILPTPAIGGVGVMKDWKKAKPLAFQAENETIIVVGETKGHLGQSLYAREIHKTEAGDAPHVDLATERKHGEFIRAAIDAGTITACHDVSDGGFAVALAEMAMASGIGCGIDHVADTAFWYGEDQARYIVTTRDARTFLDKAAKADIHALAIGKTGGVTLAIDNESVEIAELIAVNEGWLPGFIA